MPGQVGPSGSGSGGGGGGTVIDFETPNGAINGVNDDFVFSAPPVLVTYQSVIQTLGVDYTLAGSTATFTVPPVEGLVQGLVSI